MFERDRRVMAPGSGSTKIEAGFAHHIGVKLLEVWIFGADLPPRLAVLLHNDFLDLANFLFQSTDSLCQALCCVLFRHGTTSLEFNETRAPPRGKFRRV